MRKAIVSMLAAGLVVGALSGPVAAGTKTVKKTWTATVPTPLPLLAEDGGCYEQGQEDVHKDTYTFKAPKHRRTGTLTARIDGFNGDLDMYIVKGTTVIGSSTSDNLSQDYEQATVGRIKGGTTLKIVTCNWSGSPQANGSLLYKYRG